MSPLVTVTVPRSGDGHVSPLGDVSPRDVTGPVAVTSRSQWQPITHNRRTLIVNCSKCQVSEVNETNRLRRGGWRESAVGRHRRYLCGACVA
jgi:hypothetical protein